MSDYTPPTQAQLDEAYYRGFRDGWLDRARYEARTARVSDAAETVAWVLGFEEGLCVGTDATAKSAVRS